MLPPIVARFEAAANEAIGQALRTSNTIFAGAIAPALSDIQNGDLHRLPFTAKGLESEITWVRRAKSAPNPVLDGILEMVTREINRYAEPA